jgi:hypothetical protein
VEDSGKEVSINSLCQMYEWPYCVKFSSGKGNNMQWKRFLAKVKGIQQIVWIYINVFIHVVFISEDVHDYPSCQNG